MVIQTSHITAINRVKDYIKANPCGELTLANLARVACFSPFHFVRLFKAETGETLNQFQEVLDTYGPHLKNLLGVVIAIAIFIVFLRMLKKFKPSEAEVEVLNEDDQRLLTGTKSLGSGLTPELLNDLIQEKPDNVGTALKRYLETGTTQ